VKLANRIIILVALICFTTVWQTMSGTGPGKPCCSIAVPVLSLFAQEAPDPERTIQQKTDRPADSSNVLYQVMGVILVIWLGLAVFLFRIDRKVTRLDKSLPDKQGE